MTAVQIEGVLILVLAIICFALMLKLDKDRS